MNMSVRIGLTAPEANALKIKCGLYIALRQKINVIKNP